MSHIALVMVFLIGAIIISLSFTTLEGPRYKNLKVLPKDITKEQMDSVMHQFAGSLGQKCSFCHAYNAEAKSMDFASDEKKEKGVARQMMRMTRKLNKKYFEVKNSKDLRAHLEVGCYSCHHGSEHPAVTAPPMRMGPPPPPPPSGGMAPQDSSHTQHQ